jgi:type I restriction enzyme, S subunit
MKQGWNVAPLISLCDEITDGSHFSPKSKDADEYPYITVRDLTDGVIDFTGCKFIDSEAYSSLVKSGCQPNNGDILFSKDGTVGKVALVDSQRKFVVLSSLAIIRPKHRLIASTYLKYALLNPSFLATAIGKKTGVAIRRIILKNLKPIDVSYPNSIAEQTRIVAKLDQAFTAIDQAKANVERNLQNAKDLFQSQLNEIFSQRGEGWIVRKLGDVCDNLDSKRIPITKSKRTSGKIPYYGASGIVDYVADYIFDEDLLLVSEDGANLLARTYPIAFSISGKTWVNNHAHALKFHDMRSQIFMEYYLNSIKLDDYVSGMAQPKLNQKMLNSIPVPFPTMDTQGSVVAKLNILKSQTQSLQTTYQQEMDALDELKKSILQKAFNGEL